MIEQNTKRKCDGQDCDFQNFDGPPYGPICTICGSTEKPERTPYNAQVRRIAEILSTTHEFYVVDKYVSKRCMDAAKLMVAEMAKEYEHAYLSNYYGGDNSAELELCRQNCIDEMEERGLIPPIKTNDNAWKMTYQTRLYNAITALYNAYSGTQLVYRREFEDAAKGVIESQAEAIREFIQNTYYAPDTIEVKKFADKYLLEHGYIEPKNEKGGNK